MKYILNLLLLIPFIGIGQTCFVPCGGSADLEAFNTPATVSYLWSTGENTKVITPDPICNFSVYSVTVTDDCGTTSSDLQTVATNTVAMSLNSNPNACAIQATVVNCENPSIEWYDPDGNFAGTGQTILNIDKCGIWTAELVDCNGCTNCTFTQTIDFQSNVCCIDCTCSLSMVVDDANCELDLTVTGAGCNNYTIGILKYATNTCTGGNCSLYNNLPAVSQSVSVDQGAGNPTCSASGPTDTGYRAVLFPNSGTGCTPSQTSCDFIECCDEPDFNVASLPACNTASTSSAINPCSPYDQFVFLDYGCNCPLGTNTVTISSNESISSWSISSGCNLIPMTIISSNATSVTFEYDIVSFGGASCNIPPCTAPGDFPYSSVVGHKVIDAVDECGNTYQLLLYFGEC